MLTSFIWKGLIYEGRTLEDEEDLRLAARKETDESREIWACYNYSKENLEINSSNGLNEYNIGVRWRTTHRGTLSWKM